MERYSHVMRARGADNLSHAAGIENPVRLVREWLKNGVKKRRIRKSDFETGGLLSDQNSWFLKDLFTAGTDSPQPSLMNYGAIG